MQKTGAKPQTSANERAKRTTHLRLPSMMDMQPVIEQRSKSSQSTKRVSVVDRVTFSMKQKSSVRKAEKVKKPLKRPSNLIMSPKGINVTNLNKKIAKEESSDGSPLTPPPSKEKLLKEMKQKLAIHVYKIASNAEELKNTKIQPVIGVEDMSAETNDGASNPRSVDLNN